MPRAILSGQSLANAIYAITDKLETEFAAEFIAQMRKLSRRKSLQELLDQIEGGYYSSVATIPTSLLSLQIDTSKLNAIARKAMGSAARITDEKIGLNIGFNVRNPTIIEAARNISVDLSTNLSQTSQKILDKVIGDAMEGIVTRREAVKIIESRVGLLPTHSDAVDRYYDTLIQSGATKASAKKLADKYADRLLRYRANTIARTEIARATGIGQAEFWRQAVADGSLPPDAKRVWTTSYDERVCEICGPMNNIEVGIFEQWLTPNGFVDYPSAIHPNCRCSQGIAMSAAQKRLFVGKTDGEQFENYVLSKFNPNHDELGRFSSGSARRVSQMPKGKGIYRDNKQKIEEGPVLKNGHDKFGFPKLLSVSSAKKKFGDTLTMQKLYFSKKGIELFVGANSDGSLKIDTESKSYFASLQAIDDLLDQVNISKIVFEEKVTGSLPKVTGSLPKVLITDVFGDTSRPTVGGTFTPLFNNIEIFLNPTKVMQDDYVKSKGLKVIPTSIYTVAGLAIDELQNLRSNMQAIAPRLAYGATIHEFGHWLDKSLETAKEKNNDAGYWSEELRTRILHQGYKATSDSMQRFVLPLAQTVFSSGEEGILYSNTAIVEKFAENFTSWFLLSKVNLPRVKKLKQNLANFGGETVVGAVVELLKEDIIVDDIFSWSPNHPVFLFAFYGQTLFDDDIEKFNPNHDELGRFTFASGNRTISAKPKMSRRALGLKGKVSSIIRFSSVGRKAAVEKLATEGSSKLLMPPDANGIAQVLPQGAADKRYGKTVAQIKKSIAKLGVESVVVTPEFAKGKNARRQMQATAQALEEAKAMGIPIDKLTMRFTTALKDADGEYGGDQDKRAGDMVIDYTDDRRAKLIANKVASDSGPRILNAPTVAQTEYTSDYPVVTSQTDLPAKYTYGVTVHEIGHHYTYVNANNPNAKRQFGLETPAKYGTSDVYEMLAEGFTAWWLLGNSKVKNTQTFYKRWIPFVKVVLNGNDTGFGIPTPEALLKAMVRKTKVLNLLELSPTHPLMVYLTDGASIPDDIEKFNPYHDELGRFTFASAGGRKVGGVERKKIKPTRRKILQNKKTKRETGESGSEEYVVGDGKEIIAKNFGIKTLVKAGVLSEEDYLWCVNTYIHEMGFYGTEDSAMKRIGLASSGFQSGKIDDNSVFYKIVAQKQLSNALKAKMSGKEMSDAATSLSTLHKRMTDAKEIRIYGGLSQFVGGKDGKTSYANEELNNIGDSIYDTFSEFIIAGWAGSSGRDVSLMMSSYAEALLKAEGTYQQNGYEQVFSKAVWYFNTGIGERALDKLLRTSVQGIYDNTQKILDSQGVTHVRVYRGYEDKDSVTVGNNPIVDRISTRPLASWSLDVSETEPFGTTTTSVVVDKSQIFSFPTTGLGCLQEAEVVLKGFDYSPAPVIKRSSLNSDRLREKLKEIDELADDVSENPDKYGDS